MVTRAIDHTMQRLRDKLGEDPRVPRHLVTVRGVGYRLVLPTGSVEPRRPKEDAPRGFFLGDRRVDIHRQRVTRGEERSELIGSVHQGLGYTMVRQRRLDEAESSCRQAVAIFRAANVVVAAARAELGLGGILQERGDLDGAERALLSATRHLRELEVRSVEAQALNALGDLLVEAGRLGEAADALHTALRLNHTDGGRAAVRATVLRSLSDVHLLEGQLDAAEACLRETRALLPTQTSSTAWNDVFLATCLAARGRHDAAEATLQRAEEVFAAPGLERGRAVLPLARAGLRFHRDPTAAVALTEAIDVARRPGPTGQPAPAAVSSQTRLLLRVLMGSVKSQSAE